jgi:hypothetical protein
MLACSQQKKDKKKKIKKKIIGDDSKSALHGTRNSRVSFFCQKNFLKKFP